MAESTVPSTVAQCEEIHLTCNAGDTEDMGFIPGLGRSPGVGNSDPFQYSCQENPMDRGAWQVQSIVSQRLELD